MIERVLGLLAAAAPRTGKLAFTRLGATDRCQAPAWARRAQRQWGTDPLCPLPNPASRPKRKGSLQASLPPAAQCLPRRHTDDPVAGPPRRRRRGDDGRLRQSWANFFIRLRPALRRLVRVSLYVPRHQSQCAAAALLRAYRAFRLQRAANQTDRERPAPISRGGRP